jgi:alanine-glyoxylate transaminase / serine-glyoxylate transaminase / serine-pyruvate transaminase
VTFSLAGGPQVVAIPGPSVVPQRVLEAMARPMPDIYAGDLLPATDALFDALPALARTRHQGFVTISNGHGAWEMALSNTMSRGELALVLECGRFAQVWAEMAEFNGLRVELMTASPGRAIDPELLTERLAADAGRDIKAVLMAHVDTGSSVRNDVPAIRRVLDAADHPALLMVDCIATLGCERYEMDAWGVDVTIGASQKGLMTPPGLGLVWAGERAWAAHRTADMRTRYWDWTMRSKPGPHYLKFCGTPPVAHVFGFSEALAMIEEEGLEHRWARHHALADAVRAAVDAWSAPGGVSLYAQEPAEQGDPVTAIAAGTIDPRRLAAICDEQCGVTLGVGLGDLEGKGFRIAHMGHVNAPMVLGVLGAVEASLRSMGAPVGGSGVAAAATALGRSLAGAPA